VCSPVSIEDCLGVPVKALRELAAPGSTSYQVRRLTIDLVDGRRLEVFLKNFDASPHAPPEALRRGMRERYVYEKILAGRGLGTPKLYGVVWDNPTGPHWLLLEFLQGQKLRRHPIGDRIAAAGWLGRLVGSVAGHEADIARPSLLLRYDDRYFRNTAERALRAVDSRSSALQRRLVAAVAGYEALIEKVCSAQPTLVHGSYRPLNILVDARSTPPRICPADWELAAIGPPLHDLAFLADGCDRPLIELLCASYAEAAAAFGLSTMPTDEMVVELARLRLHKVLRSLARSAEWAYSDRAVTTLVTMAETIRREVG
jgi:aminoglycoside phosphotransferase (APT) family kinase protein